tara:strand:+ start:6435 stop:8537 length:2103 start_codon:yes stop_codon:yes gene_type:complete
MSLIEIPIFDGGLITNCDPEDISTTATIETKNFETDVRGKLVKRQGRAADITLSNDHIDNITKWTNQDLSSSIWVYYEPQANKIKKCAANFTGAADIKALSGSNVQSRISNYGRILRFANGLTDKGGWYSQLDRKFFLGGLSFDDFHYDNSAPEYPTTWTGEAPTEFSAGLRASGHYYYKFSAVLDGVQEAPLPEGYGYFKLENNDKTLRVNLKLNKSTGNFNPRITSIKVYRSYSPTATGNIDPVFYHIHTIPVNTESDHDDIKSYTGTKWLGMRLYSEALTTEPTNWPGSGGNNDTYKFYVQAPGGTNNTTKYELLSAGNSGGHYAEWNNAYVTIHPSESYNSAKFANNGFNEGFKIIQHTVSGGAETTAGDLGYDEASGGYWGKSGMYFSSWSWTAGEADGNVAQDDTHMATEKVIVNSSDKAIQFDSDHTTAQLSENITITNGYRWIISSDDVTLRFYDYNYADKTLHPLGEKTKITVNHKYSAFINGRQFVGNVRLDPDGEAEDHEDWVIYSELLQPDVLPITNYIQIKDTQGGQITGLLKHFGSLLVFMERGVYRLGIPSTNPSSFTLEESEENIGAVAPDSIIQIGEMVFFAGKDNAYMLDQGFNVHPITEPIKDKYQAQIGNIAQSEFIYDPKKGRMLCRFGDDGKNIYVLDIRKLEEGNLSWSMLDLGTSEAQKFAIDEDLKVFSISNLAS